MEIRYKPHEGKFFKEPVRGSEGAAGWDLVAADTVELFPGIPQLVPTYIDVEVPEGHMLLVLPRSGNALKRNLLVPNSPGLVDEDYRGHLGVIMTWLPSQVQVNKEGSFTINPGDRIAQAILVEYKKQEWTRVRELSSTERGRGGFGSTGQSSSSDTHDPTFPSQPDRSQAW